MHTSTHRNVSGATLFQLLAEAFSVVVAVLLAFKLRGVNQGSFLAHLAPALVFAFLMVLMQGIFGIYRRDGRMSMGAHAMRLVLAMLVAVPLAYYSAEILPGGDPFRETISEWVLIAFAGLIVVRHVVIRPVLKLLLPHRVLVLGTGTEARVVEASILAAEPPGIHLVGFYNLEKVQENAVSPHRVVARGNSIEDTVRRLGIDEIIVAVRQQRGGVLPLRGLLECRLSGVRITDLARFFERMQGRIPIEALKASWLIYGNGFRQSWLRTAVKRVFDIVAASLLLVVTLPIMLVTAIVIAFESGFPVIYRQERVGLRGATFHVLKFRSMRQDAEKDGRAMWAKVGDARVTPFGRFIRRARIDELPQVLNVLRGEMSFVGPRPERPVFVAMLSEQIPFYAVRHSVKPGITGWAQVRYSYGANVEQSMKKLEYDLYYVKNHTLFLDILILLDTIRVVVLGKGAR